MCSPIITKEVGERATQELLELTKGGISLKEILWKEAQYQPILVGMIMEYVDHHKDHPQEQTSVLITAITALSCYRIACSDKTEV